MNNSKVTESDKLLIVGSHPKTAELSTLEQDGDLLLEMLKQWLDAVKERGKMVYEKSVTARKMSESD